MSKFHRNHNQTVDLIGEHTVRFLILQLTQLLTELSNNNCSHVHPRRLGNPKINKNKIRFSYHNYQQIIQRFFKKKNYKLLLIMFEKQCKR